MLTLFYYDVNENKLLLTHSRKVTEEENVLSYLVGEGLSKGMQILIFCPSKLNCFQTCTALLNIICPERDVVTENETSSNNSISSKNCSDSNNGNSNSSSSGIAADKRTAQTAHIDMYRDSINSRLFISHQRYTTHTTQSLNSAHTNHSHTVHEQGTGTGTDSELKAQAQIQNQRKKEELRKKIQTDRLSAIGDLLASGANADPGLLEFLSNGFAFHHAGLSLDERGVVEMAFRTGSANPTENTINL